MKNTTENNEEKLLKLNEIRKLLPLNFEEETQNADIISTLIGSVKYLHLTQIPFIDNTLIFDSRRRVSEIMGIVLSENFGSQALHSEILRLLDINRDFIESQLTDLIQAVLEYLESNIVELKRKKLDFAVFGTSHQYSLSFFKLMQKNIFGELTQIYSLIRDLILCR